MGMGKFIVVAIFLMLVSGLGESKCTLPKLGWFDCGNSECVEVSKVCDDKNDCNGTHMDEVNCTSHFRKVCLKDGNILLDTEILTNTHVGYNVISGYTLPVLDYHALDTQGGCRKAEANPVMAQSIQPLPLLPHNIAKFTFLDATTLSIPEFQSSVFDNAYDAFLDMKKRKSVVVKQDMTYEKDLQTLTLTDAYKTSRVPGGDLYWFDEQGFWQTNTPLIRFHLEKVTGEFKLRPLEQLALNPELPLDLASCTRQAPQNSTGEKEMWWKLFDKYGTHVPIGGAVGGWVEIIAKRKICSKKNGTGTAHVVSMAEINNCLMAKVRDEPNEERTQCGKIERKFGVQSISEVIDWTYRRVVGGNASILGAPDQFPVAPSEIEAWTKTVHSDAKSLSTTLAAICELIGKIGMENRENGSGDIPSKVPCQQALLAYVQEKDVLHVPEPSMIPCRKDAQAVWRLVDKKFVLRGLPWCLSMTNEEGSCPAPAALSAQAFRAALVAPASAGGGDTRFTMSSFVSMALLIFGTACIGRDVW